MLILEIAAGVAAGVVLGGYGFVKLWQLSLALGEWRKDRRWARSDRKFRNKVTALSRRYSRHLLTGAGVNLPLWADPLDIYMPIDGGETTFDPSAAAEIETLARRSDALR
jgi:hypothetical protein